MVCIVVSDDYNSTIFGGLDVTDSDYNCSNYHPDETASGGAGLSVGAIAGIIVAAVVVVVAVVVGVVLIISKQGKQGKDSPANDA